MDNKGWGLNTMLAMVAVILIALLVATFFAIRFNTMIGNSNNDSEAALKAKIDEAYYVDKVNSLTLATSNYIDDMDIVLSNDELKININTLINKDYIDPIKDYSTKNECDGYSIAYKNVSNVKIIKSYINCDNYTSKGYGE